MTQKQKSRILKEVQESATGLLNAGLISKREMAKFDALCALKVTPLTPRKIKLLRKKSNMSQAVFAALLNTSVSTVQKWELGDKHPSGPSLKLLSLIERKGLEAVL